jgi:hypothetical protein
MEDTKRYKQILKKIIQKTYDIQNIPWILEVVGWRPEEELN